MRNYKCEGIILKRSDFMESDRLLTIFSKEHGKIRAIAKGVKKPLSKLGGNIELFYKCDFVISKGKNIDIITSVNLKKRYKNIYDYKEILTSIYCMAELIYNTINDEEGNILIYKMFEKALNIIDKKNSRKLVLFFELKLYGLLGFMPEIDKCAKCQEELTGEIFYFNYQQGGVLCKNCAKNDITISQNTVKLFRLIQKRNIDYLDRINFSAKYYKEISKCLEMTRDDVLQKDIKSMKYWLN